jgi:DNA polymerase epsilon subunit 1
MNKEDLGLKNHLSGLQKKYMKISFYNVQGLLRVREDLMPAVKANQARNTAADAYEDPTLNL